MDQQFSVGESHLPKSIENEVPADNHSNLNEEDGTATDHDFHPDLSSESSDAATLEQRRAYKIELQVLLCIILELKYCFYHSAMLVSLIILCAERRHTIQ